MTTFATPLSLSPASFEQRQLVTLRLCGLSFAGLALALACLSAQAQTQAQAPDAEAAPAAGIEQKTERIIHHDRGSRIEELRVGGQTRSIQVETNSQVPGYQVQPIDPAQSAQDKGAAGKSSWRVIRF
jgi:hypothetical protein